MFPRVLLPFVAAEAQHWLMFNLLSTGTFRSFSEKPLLDLQLVGPQHVLIHGVIPPQVQDLAFPFVEPHEIPVDPLFHPIEQQHNHLV